MENPVQRDCASCGAANAATAGFCWQCYAPFAAAVPVATGSAPAIGGYAPGLANRPGLAPPAPPSPVQVPRRGTSSAGGWIVRGIGILVGLAIGYGGFNWLTQTQVELPDSVQGVPRITGQEDQLFQDGLDVVASQEDLEIVGAMYGDPGAPAFLAIAIESPAVETTDQLFDSLIEGTAGAGVIADGEAATSGSRNGAEYRCVPLEVPTVQLAAGACMWRDDDTVGVVMAMDRDVDQTLELLFDVRSASTG